ncbi:Uncharacterized protein TCM_005954 [Theobroma cacao]|uniref:RNase H type-1 domain-containing protein n=1 Tax=Theobroma cacao TaxID=3641 RepID=A0A061E3F1_THECC|nr:Uncharacterized protein TCM_005954 [Theobroma cacao]
MRVFKWTLDFESDKESSIVQVWISFPNLRAHLFEKSALLLIAKAIGNPLGVDEATANGTRPSVARVFIEYDCLKPPIESVWIVTSKRGSEDVTGGYLQKVDFAPMPEYCNHCCHVGHGMENCLVLGQKSGFYKPKTTEKPTENSQGNLAVNRTMEVEEMNQEKEAGGKNIEKRKAEARMAVPKHLKTWQVVHKGGSSGAKDARGVEIASQVEEEEFVQTSNRFSVMEKLQEKECEKQGKTASRNSLNARKNLAMSEPIDVDERQKTKVTAIKRNVEMKSVAAGQCRDLSATETPAQVKGSSPIEPTGEIFVQVTCHGNGRQGQTRKAGGEKAISEFSAVGRTNTTSSQIVHGKRSKKDGFHSEKDEEMTAPADDGTLVQQTEHEGATENSKKCFFKTQLQGPWMVGGDFNSIVSTVERLNGAAPHVGSMEDFASTLFDCGLLDAGFEGNSFTWTNNHMFQRLDRVVYNPEWAQCFSSTRVQHLNQDGSDHCPLLISCNTAGQKGASTFRFLHAWTKHHDFLPFITRSWQTPLQGSGLSAFWFKQQRLKRDLKWWNKHIFGDIFEKLRLAEEEAEKREIEFQHNPSLTNRNLMHKAYAKLNRQLSIEELFWQQKSGVKCLGQYLSGCQMPISHISFADDIVIFTNGGRSALQNILSFLQEYEQVSGQKVNHQKSCFITANGCPLSRRQIISHTTGFQHKTLPVTYLGAPLHKGPKKNDMSHVYHFYNGDTWDVDKLKSFLPTVLVEEILQVPFDKSREDVAYWTLTSNGDFSTRSAGEMIRQRQTSNALCSFIWHRSIPLSISFFLWKTLHNWIPVELRMKEKGIQLASKCVCCNSEESLIHVLWENPVAKQVWNFFAKLFQIYILNPRHVSQIIWAWYVSGDYVRKGHFRVLLPLFICWFLWLERNDAKHRHTGLYPDRVIWRTMKHCRQLYDGSLLQQWQWKGDTDIAAMLGFSFPPQQHASPQIIYWKKPSIGEYKLNVDGSSRNGLHAATGGVLRDHTGKLIFGFSENIGPCNSLQAELRALLRGLLLCKERHIEKLWIEMDALAAIQLIQPSKKGPYDIRYLLESIRMCLSSFSYRLSHTFREGNKAADYLSNEGHKHQNLCVFTEAQGQLHGMLKLDRLNLPYVRFRGM